MFNMIMINIYKLRAKGTYNIMINCMIINQCFSAPKRDFGIKYGAFLVLVLLTKFFPNNTLIHLF